LQFLLTAALQLVLARRFSPDAFGAFAVLFSSVSLGHMTASLRLPLQIIRQGEAERALYWSAAIQEALLVSVLLGAACAVAHAFSAELVLLLAAAFLLRLVDLLKAFQERASNHVQLLRWESFSHFAANGAVLTCACAGMGSWVLALRELLIPLIFLGLLYPRQPLRWRRVRWEEWKSFALAGRSLWVDGLLEQSLSRLSVLIARWWGGEAGAGLYYQAQRLVCLPHTYVCSVISRYALHLFSRACGLKERERARKQLCRLLTPPLALGALLMMWKGKGLLVCVLGSAWAPTAEVVQAMAGVLVFMTLFSVHKMYLVSVDAARSLLQARLWQIAGFMLPLAVLPVRKMWVVGLSFSCGYLGALLSTSYSLSRTPQTDGGLEA
jgi:O-antigen/teichoic acid export membrane protein